MAWLRFKYIRVAGKTADRARWRAEYIIYTGAGNVSVSMYAFNKFGTAGELMAAH